MKQTLLVPKNLKWFRYEGQKYNKISTFCDKWCEAKVSEATDFEVILSCNRKSILDF